MTSQPSPPPESSPEPPGIRPLEGVTALDFTRHMAGPVAAHFLADYGADVIKVEGLPRGDGSRATGTAYRGDESALFLMWNRGKRSVALDLRDPETQPILDRLVAGADVLIESFRPGVADALGIGYERLRGINPRLVYVSVSAFGPSGPLSGRPGTDPVVQAMSGVVGLTGEADGDPVLVGVPIADFAGAMVAAQGALLGLMARERTGQGQRVDISMLLALMSALGTRLATHWVDGVEPERVGGGHSVVAPYQIYRTRDGHAVAGVWGAGDSWTRFCAAVGLPELVDDARFATNDQRMKHKAELNATLGPVFAHHSTDEWAERFERERALFGPVLKVSDVISHPQVLGSGVFGTVEHTTLGPIPQLGPVIALSETPGALEKPPPVLGEHTTEVLAEFGIAPEVIAALLSKGVARQAELADGDAR